jgi:hypothetical protein
VRQLCYLSRCPSLGGSSSVRTELARFSASAVAQLLCRTSCDAAVMRGRNPVRGRQFRSVMRRNLRREMSASDAAGRRAGTIVVPRAPDATIAGVAEVHHARTLQRAHGCRGIAGAIDAWASVPHGAIHARGPATLSGQSWARLPESWTSSGTTVVPRSGRGSRQLHDRPSWRHRSGRLRA